MIKGHIHRILWNKVKVGNNDILEVGFIIKDLDNKECKIKGHIKINPYPSINDYIEASKTDKIYNNDIHICSYIRIELPIKTEFIYDKILKLSDKLLTKKEATFLIENNKDIWNSIDNKTLSIGKIKQHKIDKIYEKFEYENVCKDDKEKFKNFLARCGIILKNNQINNLIEKYQTSDKIIEIMNNDLIRLLYVNSIGILTLIEIADKLNHSEEQKIKLFIMNDLIQSPNGDTCITYNKLIENILKEKGKKLNNFLNIEQIDNNIKELIRDGLIIRYNDYLYEFTKFNCETNIGESLKNINNNSPYLEDFLENAEDFLENYKGSKLNNEQRESFLSIFKSNINITVGPAGTGKSEILTRLCDFIKEYSEISILFLTPTGKACDRLTKGFKKKHLQNTSYTIHKYNYYKYVKDPDYLFRIVEFNSIIENEYKIIVIDEMSMVSLNIFNTFINKINKINKLSNCVLLLLGDTNQLPSIDCGDVLNNLVLSKSFNLVELTEIFRSESEGLLVAQNNILKFSPLLEGMSQNDSSFIWIKEDPKNNDIVLKVLNDFPELPLLITSTNKVVDEYQKLIKNKYNIGFMNKKSIMINSQEFHVDDRIMIKKNDYEKQLMNGMTGKITSIKKQKVNEKYKIILNILFDGDDNEREFNLDELENIDLAYIMTIHKSQGSESQDVIILMDDVPKLNTMNLLYTAITRSKKKCILIAEERTIQTIILEKRKTKRICNLKDFC